MKKFFIIAAMLVLSIQASAQLVITRTKTDPIEKEKTVTTGFMDFRPYTENGFYLSTDAFPGNFTPIGSLEIRVDPKTTKNQERKKSSDPIYIVEEIGVQELLNIAVEAAKEKGSDGLTNLNITTVRITEGDIAFSAPIRYYVISGLCIRR